MASDRHAAVEQGSQGGSALQRHPLGGQPCGCSRRSTPPRPTPETAPELLVQVDLAGEATKHGAPPAEAMDIVRAAARCRSRHACVGLMTIPPFFEHPEDARPYFAQLTDLRATLLKEGLDPAMLRELSMGMSHDFEIAVQEGATIVRLGTAIFGKRHV